MPSFEREAVSSASSFSAITAVKDEKKKEETENRLKSSQVLFKSYLKSTKEA